MIYKFYHCCIVCGRQSVVEGLQSLQTVTSDFEFVPTETRGHLVVCSKYHTGRECRDVLGEWTNDRIDDGWQGLIRWHGYADGWRGLHG